MESVKSGKFWFGFLVGAGAFYAYSRYMVKKAS